MKFNTALLHNSFCGDKNTGATLTPIYQSSAFEQSTAEQLAKVFANKAPGFSYTRISNPTVDAFEKRMTLLEGGIVKMKLTVADEKKEYEEGLKLTELFEIEQVETPQYVTISINDEFVKSEDVPNAVLKEDDVVEFLYFMGGGSNGND